jgi:phospho-N-acetylmuramoyl-pentapeptide-transferase
MPIQLIIIIAVSAFFATALLGFIFVPLLRRLKFGQTILDIGPKWHKEKEGTPTMGGIMFIIGIVATVLISVVVMPSFSVSFSPVDSVKLWAGIGLAVFLGFIGFIDDFIKIRKKRNLGLTAKQKTFFQLLIIAAYLATIFIAGEEYTSVWIPFVGEFNFGIFYYPVMLVGIYFVVNAVNLTDGIDGLCASVTAVCSAVIVMCAGFLHIYSVYIFGVAVSAAMIGYLLWNLKPAKVFMGDTGSMFLGGAVVAMAVGINKPLILLLCGGIYIIEALSVVLQVISFKLTGKRIFKMSPIHHHFEMSKWSENKIVIIFTLVTAILGGVGYLAVII